MLLTSSILYDFLILIVIGIFLLHKYIAKKHTYWKSHGVYSPKTLPIVGNFLQPLLLKLNLAEWLASYYDRIDKPFFGLYIFDGAYFIPKDPNIVKSIIVKDFDYFIDRNAAAPDHSQLQQNMMFFQKNPRWKYDRSQLSVIFSSGKLKSMFPLFQKTNERMADYIKNNYRVMEAKNFLLSYTADVISLCAFGIDTNCFNNTPSIFKNHCQNVFEFSLRNVFSQTISFLKPEWANMFKLNFVPNDSADYFSKVFLETMDLRVENGRVGDMIDILKEILKNNDSKDYGNNFVCGVAIQFLLAGYETTSTTASFLIYELAKNIEIQDKLREEIRSVIKRHGGLNYEAVSDMKYLEMCVLETLRRYPPVPFLERKCNTDYKVPNYDVIIKKGITVVIPFYSMHMDEKYFPEPHKFIPERFINNIDNSNGLFYIPFGSGPRNCVGARFGKLSVKMAIIAILLNSEVTFCKESPKSIEFTAKCFLLQSNVGLPLMFNPLTK